MNTKFEAWIAENLESQKGKTVLVTGANAGIGYYTAWALAKKGADVIVAGRNEEKVQAAVKAIQDEGVEGSVEAGMLDLSSLSAVENFATQFSQSHSQLNILVNNAGVMMPPPSTTAEGFETQFGVNFLGHFALTGHLFSLLEKTPGARVVTVSSIGHRGAAIDFGNFRLEKPYDERREYCQSKLANIMFALELDKRIKGQGNSVLSVACHPGVSKTELQRHIDIAMLARFDYMEAWQGSLPSIVAATSPEVKGGEYYGPDGPGEINGFPALGIIDPAALDEAVAQRLWDEAQRMTGIIYPGSN